MQAGQPSVLSRSGELRESLLSSDRRPDVEETSVWDDLVEELKCIVALAGPACIQLGFQQVCINVFVGQTAHGKPT